MTSLVFCLRGNVDFSGVSSDPPWTQNPVVATPCRFELREIVGDGIPDDLQVATKVLLILIVSGLLALGLAYLFELQSERLVALLI